MDGHVVEVTPEGLWKSRYAIRVDVTPFGSSANKHLGPLRSTLRKEDRQPAELGFGRLGLWKDGSALRVEKELVMLEVKPRFNWKRIHTDFEMRLARLGHRARSIAAAGGPVRLLCPTGAPAAKRTGRSRMSGVEPT